MPVRSVEASAYVMLALFLMILMLAFLDAVLSTALAEKQRDQLRRALREIRKKDKECP